MGAKVFSSVQEAVSNMVKVKKIYVPDVTKSKEYTNIILKYKKVYEILEKGFELIK